MAINREKVLEAAQKLIEKQKYDKAVLELRRIVEADPNDARTLHKIGELQAKQGLYAEAISTYETVGGLYTKDGFAQKAIAIYRLVRETIAAHLPQAAVRYGHIAPKLVELYRQIGLNNEALLLLHEIAAGLQNQQREAELIDVYRQTATLDAANPLPHLRLAEALSRARDVEGAVAAFGEAASLLVRAGRRDDAIQVIERLLHHRPDPAHARVCGELYLERNRPPHDAMQALTKLQICYQANPQDVEVLALIARTFDLIGQSGKAADIRREIARLGGGR